MLKHCFDKNNYRTDDLFKMIKILATEQLCGKISNIEIYKNKINFKRQKSKIPRSGYH